MTLSFVATGNSIICLSTFSSSHKEQGETSWKDRPPPLSALHSFSPLLSQQTGIPLLQDDGVALD